MRWRGLPQGTPSQPGTVAAVLALSQQERFTALPIPAGSEHPTCPHIPAHSLEPAHRRSPRHHIRNDHRCVPGHPVGTVPASGDSEAKAPLRVLAGTGREGSGRVGPTDPLPSRGHPGPCSPCSASPCAAPRSPSPPWWPPANASEGGRPRQPASAAAPAWQPGARTGSDSSLQPLAPSSIPLQAATKSRSKAEPQAPGTARV